MANKTPAKGARAYPPPASVEDADRLLGEIGAAARIIERLLIDEEEEKSAIAAHFAAERAPHEEALKVKFAALNRWALDSRAKVFPEGKKSLDLSQGIIGFRATAAKVVIDEDMERAVIKALLRRKLTRMVRVKVEPDLNAIKKEPERVAGIAGLALVPGENFFAEPVEVDVERVTLTKKVPAKKRDKNAAVGGRP